MVFNKKAISPVVATALLLVVAVVAVVGFQSWFTTFQSKQLTDVELQTSSGGSSINVERVQNGSIYILNRGKINVQSSDISVTSIDGTYSCLIDGSSTPIDLTPGVKSYDCDGTPAGYVAGEKLSVIIETSSGLVSAEALGK